MAEIVITGMQGASQALHKIYDLCGEMKEGQVACSQLYENLSIIFKKLEQLQAQCASPDKDILKRYFQVLCGSYTYLYTYRNKGILYRLVKLEKMKKEMEKLTKEVDLLCKTLHIQYMCDMKSWKKEWNITMEKQCGDIQVVLNELQSLRSQQELLTTVMYEMNSRLQDHDPWTLERMKALRSIIIHHSTATVNSTPAWFIPFERVEYNEKPFDGGSFGTVHKGTWNHGTEIVVKCLRVDENIAGTKLHDDIIHEMELWYGLNHPHITKMYGASHVSYPPFIICEYAANGNLCTFLNKFKHRMWRLLYQAALGLEYLHEKNIVHGDLKLNNILVGTDGKAKLTDFGLSAVRTSSRLSSLPRDSTHSGGGLRWRAPECATHDVGFASDIYSFAMCLIEAATGRPPFANLDDHDVCIRVSSGMLPAKPGNFTDEAWDLILSMTSLNPSERIKINHVVKKLKQFAANERNEYKDERITRCVKCCLIVEWDARYCRHCGSEQGFRQEGQIIDSINDSITENTIHTKSIGNDDQKTGAAKGIVNPARYEDNKELIASSGGIISIIDLVRSGTCNQKEHAARALCNLARDNTNNVKSIVDAGGIAPLIELVHYGTDDQKYYAAGVLWNLSCNDEYRKLIANAGGIERLLDLLEHGSDYQKYYAAGALWCLACNDVNQKLIADAGGIGLFVDLIQYGTTNQKEYAAAAIMNLALNNNNSKLIADAGCIAILIELINTGTDNQKYYAVGAIWNLACNIENQKLIADADGITSLIKLINTGTVGQKDYAIRTLCNLASVRHKLTQLIIEAGGIDSLLAFINSEHTCDKKYAAKVLMLFSIDLDNRKIIVDSGGITSLIVLLQSGSNDAKYYAIIILYLVTRNNKANQVLLINANGILPITQIIQSGDENQKKYASRTLKLLARTKTNRKYMKKLGINPKTGYARKNKWWRS